MTRYSVKKPLTVVVAVIAVFVLGVISFMNMTTDLLPQMELPYIVAYASYPGASPEKVEQSLTRPIEAALATTGGVTEVTSTSSENVSMVVLEFEQDTNMDAAMIDMSGALDLIKSALPEEASAPALMRISPDMLPVMIASVDVEGMDAGAVSDYVNDSLLSAFERLDGMASVSPGGLLETSIRVELDQAKITALNDKVLAGVDSGLAQASGQISQGKAQLEQGKASLAAGRTALEQEKDQTVAALAAGSAAVDSAVAGLQAAAAQESVQAANQAAYTAERDALQALLDQKPQLDGAATAVVRAVFGAAGERPDSGALADPAAYIRDHVSDAQFAALLAQAGGALPEDLASLTRTQFLDLLSRAAAAPGRIEELEAALRNTQTALAAAQAMKAQLETSLAQAQEKYEQIESGKLTGAVALAAAQAQLASTEQTLAQAEADLAEAEAAFAASRDAAYQKAELSGMLTPDVLAKMLAAQNFEMPAGYIASDQGDAVLKVGDAYDSLQTLANTLLFRIDAGGVGDVRLSDVANVRFADNAGAVYAKINGRDGVLLTFQKQSTASTAQVTDLILETIERLEAENAALHVTPLLNQGDYIHLIIGSVLQNLLLGGILAILVLALFLKNVRPTVIVAFAIPISLLFAMALMYFTNITLNMISLSGLALGVGMLVDNAIVVIENIYRLRNRGLPPAQAAVRGAKEVAGAIFASTLTTVCVFLPIVFTEGMSRELFADMGLTIAYALLASLVVALTVVPAMSATVLKKAEEKKHPWFDAFLNGYEKALRWSLHRRAAVLAVAVALLGVSIFATARMGTSLFPAMDSAQMSADYTPSEGATDEQAREEADELLAYVESLDGVQTVGAISGGMGGMTGGSGGYSYYILLDEDRDVDNDAVAAELTRKALELGGEADVQTSNMDMSALGGSGVELVVAGPDLDTLRQTGADLAARLASIEGLTDIDAGLDETTREVRVSVDKDAAARSGLTVAQVYAALAGALQVETTSTTVKIDQKEYPVVLVSGEDAPTAQTLGEQTVKGTNAAGETVETPLPELAQIDEGEGLPSIRRENGSRTLRVRAAVDADHNVGLVGRQIERMLDGFTLPAGYTVTLAGENESINDAISDIVLMIVLAVLLIYLIMVAQFQSFLSPFIIMFTMPLAFTGGLLALLLTGQPLSVVALLGFLVLAGVVVNNGIVFVDYTNKLRLSGLSKRQALVQAGRTRMRPILMTAMTTILAMVTLALGLGDGAEMTQPVGIVIIGGLIYATALTLLVVPVLYDLFSRRPPRVVDTGDADGPEGAVLVVDATDGGSDAASGGAHGPTDGK